MVELLRQEPRWLGPLSWASSCHHLATSLTHAVLEVTLS
jgi:hypothetical protein